MSCGRGGLGLRIALIKGMEKSLEPVKRHLKVIDKSPPHRGRSVCYKVTFSQKQLLVSSLRRLGLDELVTETTDLSQAQVVVVSTGGSFQALEELLAADFKNKDAIEYDSLVKDMSGPGDFLHGTELQLFLGLSRPKPFQIIYRGLKRILEMTIGLSLLVLLYPCYLAIRSHLSLKGVQPVQARYGKLYMFFLWNRSLTHMIYNSYVMAKGLLLGDIRLIGPELKTFLPHSYEVSLRKLFGVGLLPYTDLDAEKKHWPSWLKDIYYCQHENLLLDLRTLLSLFYRS